VFDCDCSATIGACRVLGLTPCREFPYRLGAGERDLPHTTGRRFHLGFLARSPGGFCVRADCGDALSLWAQ
jgi:hypothetical protein